MTGWHFEPTSSSRLHRIKHQGDALVAMSGSTLSRHVISVECSYPNCAGSLVHDRNRARRMPPVAASQRHRDQSTILCVPAKMTKKQTLLSLELELPRSVGESTWERSRREPAQPEVRAAVVEIFSLVLLSRAKISREKLSEIFWFVLAVLRGTRDH